MNSKLLYLSLVSLIIYGALGAHSIAIQPYPMPKILDSALAKQLYVYRKQIHDDALVRIKNECNISDADWFWHMDYVARLVCADDLFAQKPLDRSSIQENDHWLVKEAKEILIRCGIDPIRIEIKLDNNPNINASAGQKVLDNGTIQHTLTLNPGWFAALSKKESKAIILHEIMHFVHYDGLEEGFILAMLEKNGYTKNQIKNNPAIINYRQQRELRADLLSVVDKPKLALANQNRYSNRAIYSKDFSPDFWSTHPSDQTRANTMAQLLAYMNNPKLA